MPAGCGGILVAVQLTAAGSATLEWAAALARGARLAVRPVHALGLPRTAQHAAAAGTFRLDDVLSAANVAVRNQLREAFGPGAALPLRESGRPPARATGVSVAAPVVALGDAVEALLDAAAEQRPELVMVPTGWDWDGWPRGPYTFTPATLRELGAPVLSGAAPAEGEAGRVVLVAESEFTLAPWITAAVGWWDWLCTAASPGRLRYHSPELDVLLLDELAADLPPERLLQDEADLVVVPCSDLDTGAWRTRDSLVRHLLASHQTPVLLLDGSRPSTPDGGERSRTPDVQPLTAA